MSTIKDVAQMAGVSASTVSRTLSGKVPVEESTKVKVWEAIRKLNYRPNMLAKGLKEGRTNTIALLIPNIRNPLFPAAARGVEDVARESGFTVILCNTDEDEAMEREYINKLINRWVDGFILATAKNNSDYLEQLKTRGIPTVLMIRGADQDMDSVVVDNFKGAYKAVSYLINRGHRNIAMINGRLDVDIYRRRLAGYRQALEDNGLFINEDLLVNGVDDDKDAYNAMSLLLDKGLKIDAVFAASDPKAIWAIKAIKHKGLRIPDDISVMGFDDLEAASIVEPALTTVSQPLYDIGAMAMRRLLELIEGMAPKHKTTVLEGRLVVRQSVR